jgi:hypothetical protein
MSKPTEVVVGVGAEQGLGAALCRRFAQGGYHVLVAGRTQAKIGRVAETIAAAGGSAEPIAMDATRESDVAGLFERAMAPGEGFDPTTSSYRTREQSAHRLPRADLGAVRGFLARRLLQRLPGRARSSAPARAARARQHHFHRRFGEHSRQAWICAFCSSQSWLAHGRAEHGARIWATRHPCSPCCDRRWHRWRTPAQTRADPIKERGEDGLLDIDAIAEAYWQIHRQPRSAWTQEVDLRPFKEPF